MDNLPFDLVGLDAAEVDSLEEVYKALKDNFDIKVPDNFKFDIDQFESIKCNQNANQQTEATLGGALKINNSAGDCYLLFVKIRFYYSHSDAYYSGELLESYRYQVWTLINQKKDFGRALIRKETFADRVLNLIHPVELEFKDDRAFSKKFYIVANEPEKATNCMNWNFRNTLMEIDLADLVIETVGNHLIIGNNDWLNPDTAVHSAKVACKIAAIR
jgi:hypothetical protein